MARTRRSRHWKPLLWGAGLLAVAALIAAAGALKWFPVPGVIRGLAMPMGVLSGLLITYGLGLFDPAPPEPDDEPDPFHYRRPRRRA